MKQITKDWLESANLDLEAISHIIQNNRLTGHVAFYAQQATEKSLKAIIEEAGERVPKIHSLSKLFELCAPFMSLIPIVVYNAAENYKPYNC
jgi:HEPN domain-containing protein